MYISNDVEAYLRDTIRSAEQSSTETRLILLVGAITAARAVAPDTELRTILDSILEAGGFRVDET